MAKILLIDDEATVRATLRDMLEEAGHEVLEAGDGDEGLAVLDANTADAVITDLIMPQKEGIETIREVRARFPAMKILAISGGSAGHMDYLEFAQKLGADKVLSKPLDFDELAQTVSALLAASAP